MKMAVASVAFGGVALSALVSAFVASWVARYNAAVEIRKQQLGLFKSYAEGLQAKRLEAYPQLFRIISNCQKQIRRGEITEDSLRDMLERAQEWDSTYSLLLSRSASQIVFAGQWALHDLLNSGSVDLSNEACTGIIIEFERIELALKQDIGVFAVEYEDNRKLESYEEGSIGTSLGSNT